MEQLHSHRSLIVEEFSRSSDTQLWDWPHWYQRRLYEYHADRSWRAALFLASLDVAETAQQEAEIGGGTGFVYDCSFSATQ